MSKRNKPKLPKRIVDKLTQKWELKKKKLKKKKYWYDKKEKGF